MRRALNSKAFERGASPRPPRAARPEEIERDRKLSKAFARRRLALGIRDVDTGRRRFGLATLRSQAS